MNSYTVNAQICKIQAYASEVYGESNILTIQTVRAANEELKCAHLFEIEQVAQNWMKLIAADQKKFAARQSTSWGE